MVGNVQSLTGRLSKGKPHYHKSFYTARDQKAHFNIHSTTNHGEKIARDEKCGKFFNEAYFNELIALEAQRTYRSGRSFLLVYVDVSRLIENDSKEESFNDITRLRVVDLLIRKLFVSTREIDIKGWMRKDRIIGVLCTEVDKNNCRIIVNKIRKNFAQSIDERFYEDIEIRWKVFPIEDPDNDKTRVISLKELTRDVPAPRVPDHTLSRKCALGSKRVIDIIGSLFAVILFSPFFVGISLLIKLTSKGPVFFKQERIGESGKPFTFLKFRSMQVNNNAAIHKEFISKHIKGEIEAGDGKEKNAYKMNDDPRVTKIGKFIRKTSLDEIPQFFNVLRGDMSLVGPRPPIPYEVEEYDQWHTKRVLDFKPGITGFWQVEGRSNTTFNDMVRMDLHYMKSWSLWLDIQLLFKTPLAVLAAKGAC